MFVVVFLVTYTASLTNLLRVGPTPLEDEQYVRILGLEDLAKQKDINFGFVEGGATQAYFKDAQVPYLRRIWEDVTKKSHTLAVNDGIHRVRESLDSAPFAFIMESAMARYMLRQKPCDLYMVGDLTITGSYALAYTPGWDLAQKVDVALLQMRENGMFKVLEDKWFTGPCDNNVLDPTITEKIKVSPFYAVTLGSFSGVLVVLLAGVFLGALVTIIEVCIFRKAEMSSDDEASTPMKGREEGTVAVKGSKNAKPAGGTGTENVTDV
ncbi:hypothetical protein V1264_018864 [Littorina saxatilis]|uniref:Ionotropic glutamate receptor C-terminal domain-containing protein n=2 Tax=Littorina saxatilis TaxID=31220 RepID=A0AAN9BG23_9CAEN